MENITGIYVQETAGEMVQRRPIFRSYVPQSRKVFSEETTYLPKVNTHEVDTNRQMYYPKLQTEVGFIHLEPRKPDWDLKRDADEKLKMLGRLTQKAAAEIIWDRMNSHLKSK